MPILGEGLAAQADALVPGTVRSLAACGSVPAPFRPGPPSRSLEESSA